VEVRLAGEVCAAYALTCCGHRPGVNADSQPAALILVLVIGK